MAHAYVKDIMTADVVAAETPGFAGHHGHPAFRHHHQPPAAAPAAAGLMTRPAVTIGPDEPVRRAAQLMSARKLRRLPVVDHDGRLVGILSRADVLSVFTRPDVILGRNIVDQVRHLEGVVAVRDRFSYPLPART
jgi:CBS domain-containing protein